MARSDLLISLIQSGKQSPDPRFRSTVEAIIAEERSKQHTALADQLSAALLNGAYNHASQTSVGSTVVGDLLYELAPERSLDDLVLPRLVARDASFNRGTPASRLSADRVLPFDTVGKERGDVHETGEIMSVCSRSDQLPAHVVIVTATNHRTPRS